VAATDYVFGPATLTIAPGDTVSWTFAGEPHTVTSGTVTAGVPRPDGKFDSGIREPGQDYALGPGGVTDPFVGPGTYPYYCAVHPEQMTGTIVVVGAASAQPTPPASTAAPASPVTPAPTSAGLPSSAPASAPASPVPSATPSQAGAPISASVIAGLVVFGSLAIAIGFLAWRARFGRPGR
jgi:plastocyanin